MKTHVLLISKTFPVYHSNAGNLTRFSEKIATGQKPFDAAYDNVKLHTIRSNYLLWKKKIEEVISGKAILSIREWSEKPYASKQTILFELDQSHGVGIEKLEFYEDKDNVPAIKYPIINNYAEPNLYEIAHNDGLSTISFKEWFKNYDLSEPMAIIHFTPFRYVKN